VYHSTLHGDYEFRLLFCFEKAHTQMAFLIVRRAWRLRGYGISSPRWSRWPVEAAKKSFQLAYVLAERLMLTWIDPCSHLRCHVCARVVCVLVPAAVFSHAQGAPGRQAIAILPMFYFSIQQHACFLLSA
jgi:hypothetical protein